MTEKKIISESQLQAQCVLWYHNEHYQNPRNLWATFNEGRDVNTKRTMGLLEGVSDLLYFCPIYGLTAIEMKFEGKSHETKRLISQAEWILEVPKRGGFCDSLEMFQQIIRGKSQGIDPQAVINYCKQQKTKTITWKNERFKNFIRV